MTKLQCTPEGYKQALKDIADKGESALFRFYSMGRNFEKRRTVFSTQVLPFYQAHGNGRYRESLDIGYGPGALVMEAAKHFVWSYGIDVHGQDDFVHSIIMNRGCYNARFYTGDGRTLSPFIDNSFDLVYSWTVFMHMGTIAVVESYLKDIFRVLRPDGIAVIYFARMYRKKGHETKDEWLESIDREHALPLYREKGPKKIQKINLTISMRWFEQTAEKYGFELVEKTASTRAVHAIEYYHGQHGVVLRKPKGD